MTLSTTLYLTLRSIKSLRYRWCCLSLVLALSLISRHVQSYKACNGDAVDIAPLLPLILMICSKFTTNRRSQHPSHHECRSSVCLAATAAKRQLRPRDDVPSSLIQHWMSLSRRVIYKPLHVNVFALTTKHHVVPSASTVWPGLPIVNKQHQKSISCIHIHIRVPCGYFTLK